MPSSSLSVYCGRNHRRWPMAEALLNPDTVIALASDERAGLAALLSGLEKLKDAQEHPLTLRDALITVAPNHWESLFKIRKDVFGY